MQEFYLKYIQSNLHKLISLIYGFLFCILFFSIIDNFIEKIILNVQTRFLFYGLILSLWIAYWVYYRYRLPRNKKKKVGIVLAIHAETNYEEIRLKSDFISKLRENINKEKFSEVINIIILKNHLSGEIEKIDDVLKMHKKIKGHFYVYGEVKRRYDGDKKYFLKLEGMVIHRPINIKTKDLLRRDFISVLPKQVSFFENFEFKGFEFTADIVYLATRYITGTAAYLSGDPILAHDFHLNLKEEFNKFRPLPLHLQNIRDKIPLLLSDEELIIARWNYLKNNYKELVKWLDESLSSNQNNYGSWLLKAIVDFYPSMGNNPPAALEDIKKAEKYARGTYEWRYSKAFLYFWMEYYNEALKDCKNLSQKSYVGENITINEVENFNLKLLEKYKNKVQLYFWLGYINYIKKRNLPMAYKYFSEFEQKSNVSMGVLKQRSNIYLAQIKSEMKVK